MNDWYEVLGVSPDASQEDIAAAFGRLVPTERNPRETEDESEERRLREYAFAVLSSPERRRAYDTERAGSQTTLAHPAPGAPPPGQRGGLSIGLALGGLAIILAIAAVAATAFFLLRDDGGENFADREDDDYDLEAMRLREQDIPAGFVHTGSLEFNNEEWSPLYFSIEELQDPETLQPDLESKQRELDAEGRVRGFWSAYQTSEFGRTIFLFSNSTLYVDEESADKSLGLYCGLPFDERRNVEVSPLALPALGDESTGFISESVISAQFGIIMELEIPPIYRDSNYCFRTGRVVHAVSMMSVPGAEDIALGVRLARKMESRVQDFYDGKEPPPESEDSGNGESEDGGG